MMSHASRFQLVMLQGRIACEPENVEIAFNWINSRLDERTQLISTYLWVEFRIKVDCMIGLLHAPLLGRFRHDSSNPGNDYLVDLA